MPKAPDLLGRSFGRLTVIERSGYRGQRALWLTRCECGENHRATTSDLRYGGVQSCGCLLHGITSANYRHGGAARSGTSRTYNTWRAMIERCTNPNSKHYQNYGGRGISVCEKWREFSRFLEDMGERPDGKTIDRINVNGNYEVSNCRWASALEQRHNRRDCGAAQC